MSKPSTTNCPKLSFVCLFFLLYVSCMACFTYPCLWHGHPYGVLRSTLMILSGGYCVGVPPLPIPNREVKPDCADGTAMQCGRVGSCLFLYWSPDCNEWSGLRAFILSNSNIRNRNTPLLIEGLGWRFTRVRVKKVLQKVGNFILNLPRIGYN